MRVKVVANELVDTDIEMVSLVRHGANRAPFKVLKSEDPDDKPSLGDKLQSFFSLKKDEFAVTAYFIRKDAAEAILPVLKAEGVDISATSEADGVVMVAVSDAQAHGFIQLNDALAVGVDQPIREFSDESVVKAYAEGVGLSQFAPGVSLALQSLDGAVWTLLNSTNADEVRDRRVAKVDSMIASFRKYITSLAKALPEQVFRVEAATRNLIKTEESPMKGKLAETVPGDLDGLTETVTKTDAPVTATTTDTIVVKADEIPAVDPAPAEAAAAPSGDAILKALEALTSTVADLAKSVQEQRVITDSLTATVVESTQLAKSASDAASRTTLVHKGEDLDLALSSLGGRDAPQSRRIEKSGEALWDGLMSDLTSFRPSR